MIDKTIIGKKCRLLIPDAIFPRWDDFWRTYNLDGTFWKEGFEPEETQLDMWEVVSVVEYRDSSWGALYPEGVAVLQKTLDEGPVKIIFDAKEIFVYGRPFKHFNLEDCRDCLRFQQDNFYFDRFELSKKYYNPDFQPEPEQLSNWASIRTYIVQGDKIHVLMKYFNGENHQIAVREEHLKKLNFKNTINIWEGVF